jgi:hypothetical protein
MKKKHFDWESVFAHIWQNCDPDGIWDGDGTTLAANFRVKEDDACTMLGQLCDRGLIEKLYQGRYGIVLWRERDNSGAGELRWEEITDLPN